MRFVSPCDLLPREISKVRALVHESAIVGLRMARA